MKSALVRLLAPVLLVALALCAGCDTAPQRQARSTLTCILVPDHPADPVKIAIVTGIKVVLPGPDAGSNLVWEIASNNNKVLEQTTPLRVSPGSPVTTTASFYALKPGKSVLRFFLVPPGNKEAVPAARCELTVRVSD